MPRYTSIFKTDTLGLALCRDGYWLYDYTLGMSLAMRAETEHKAVIEALEYYQKRLKTVEAALKEVKLKVNNFVSQFEETEED